MKRNDPKFAEKIQQDAPLDSFESNGTIVEDEYQNTGQSYRKPTIEMDINANITPRVGFINGNASIDNGS